MTAGDVVALRGVLGSGKSVFARGILRALGIGGYTPSPSFIIVATYQGTPTVNHIDLYRLRHMREAVTVGIEEVLSSGGVSVIEWAERLGELLPESRVDVEIVLRNDPNERLIKIAPLGDDLRRRLLPMVLDAFREMKR